MTARDANALLEKLDELHAELDRAYDLGDYSFEIVMRMQLEVMRVVRGLVIEIASNDG